MANLFISQANVFRILINLAYLLQMLVNSLRWKLRRCATPVQRRVKGCDDYSFKSPGRQASLSGLIWRKTPPVIAERVEVAFIPMRWDCQPHIREDLKLLEKDVAIGLIR